MSGDGYPTYYYHAQASANYAASTGQTWNAWNLDPQYMQNYARTADQSYTRNSATYHSNTVNHNHNSHGSSHSAVRSQGYHTSPSASSRPYYRNRYSNNQYSGNSSRGWQRNQNNFNKRARVDSAENEPLLKTAKKKKKPLSQNIPTRREWTMEEAEQALTIEKEYNKKAKYALIIKFPDQELNKEIVAQFHPSIENVHFQQPCTPRFCFVTLQETASPDEVISGLNKQKFGDGFLTAEIKKDREEDQAINPEDIDPLTLYVGNLAQEITKDDMVNMYPNTKRIDIGFAKKMKFTRYAFVGFKTVSDSIDAFKKTHSKQMYNKSLIVRFRRLHGTVGMPGESKPQNPPKNKDDSCNGTNSVTNRTTRTETREEDSRLNSIETSSQNVLESEKSPVSPAAPSPAENPLSNNVENIENIHEKKVKLEQASPNDSDDEITIKPGGVRYQSPLLQANADDYIVKPKVKTEQWEDKDKTQTTNQEFSTCRIKSEEKVQVKNEPCDNDWANIYYEHDESDEEDSNISSSMTDFDSMYEMMVNHANKINSLRKGDP